MILVKTCLNKSKIHGMGLFANENIKSGTIVYKPSPGLDIKITDEEFFKIEINCQETIRHYGFKSKVDSMWHLAFDDIRFCNHSKSGNLSQSEINNGKCLITNRDIKKGEELLQNYSEFEILRDVLK